ncbi:HIRAN domain-containing protein [Promethearchaeum syntrophicum]|uniref:HIRAN domain-containing protein n=1 Tax=Promethearchaeum syntrophicum TaxID=2594042 RepID=A0A5B9D8V6_9ARCH|nr:HIRAN domain-containing protein [Candidatus Prometheoarchaeum syntrophicum]QEE15544.1 HIRAN domain protein [Candidatus Prometheoarchaeum syntrophicum]
MNELQQYNNLLANFVNPRFNNKAGILSEILPLFKRLLNNSEIGYYCSECHENHFSGKKYQNHKQYLEISPIFPKIPSQSPDTIYYQQIVGIYYTKNGHILKRLPQGTIFTLKPEPYNQYDSHAVSVWFEKSRIGYLPRHTNTVIFNALSSEKVTCMFGRYRPSFSSRGGSYWDRDRHSPFSPERADITIHIFNPQKLNEILEDYIRLIAVSNNLPDFQDKIAEGLYVLGYRTIKILENQRHTTNLKNILSKLYYKFKITIKDSEFSIIL